MIRRSVLALTILFAVAAAEPCAGAKRVLFIGNSYTYTNGLPTLVEQIARSKDVKLQTTAIASGGAALKDHWNAGRAEAFRTSHFDFVVLQPQSSEVVRTPDDTTSYAQMFADAIRASGAEPLLFAPWHPAEFDRLSAQFREGYRRVAEEAQVRLAPVAAAWERAQSYGVKLYADDGSHPNLAGSYLAACVLFSAISGVDPTGAWHPDGISDDTARTIQRAAAAPGAR